MEIKNNLNKNLLILLFSAILIEMGEKMGERFLPLYIMALGGSSLAISFLNASDNFLSAIYSFPGGYLSDRIGYKKSLILFNFLAILGYIIIIVFPSWQGAIIGAILFISWSAVSLPSIMSAVSKILPFHKRTFGVSLHSISRRIPMAIGPLLGGLCIEYWGEKNGIRIAFSFSLLFAVIAILLQNYFLEYIEEPKTKTLEKNPFKVLSFTDSKLRHLLVSDILIRFCEQIPYAFVVIWIVKNLNKTPVDFGLLTMIEMVSAILIYLPVAYLVEKNKTKKPYITITFIFFTIFPLFLMLSKSIHMLIFTFIIRGLKEFGEPTRKALILDLSPEQNKAITYGAYYLFRDLIVSIAAFGGGFLWMISPKLNFMTAFAFGIIGTIYFLIYVKE